MIRCAIVGGGLAGFTAYQTLRRAFTPDEIVVFDACGDPAAAFAQRARAIRQTHMRSESDGHCLPTSFPGLAVRESLRRLSPAPVLRSLASSYNPTVDDFLAHVSELRERSDWDSSVRRERVEAIDAEDGFFRVRDVEAPYVLVATGHPGLNVPDELGGDERVVHSYEPHEYASTVTVVGAGLAAATEWANALAAGSTVISVRRREPVRRRLNVPREWFSRRALAGYHRLDHATRAETLRSLLAPSFPHGPRWDEAAARVRVERRVNGTEQVIAATGFRRGFHHDPLLRRLVAENALETYRDWIVLDRDSTVPALSDGRRALALAGVAGQWAFPAADTLVGAKYAARGLLARCRTR
ncbi:MAG TPA: FAD-dependent oxidoreductase [Gaiellaceae bacterium]|nr:FAD-dependent oxidoreductase [Gaiellaceae bacterium]